MAMIDDVKAALKIDGTDSDNELNRLIASATREYLAFVLGTVPSDASSVDIPEDAINGIILMVKADYDADATERKKYRDAAETLWMPYRENLGV